jgi:CBS domain-containing protein
MTAARAWVMLGVELEMPTTTFHTRGLPHTGDFAGDHLDTPVRDVMTPGVVSIPEDSSLTQALRAMRAHDIHAVLVVGSRTGAPLGWITARGMLAWIGRDTDLVHARDAVTERAETIDAGACARDALRELSQAGITHLLVSRNAGGLPEGVLSAINLVTLERG